MEIELERDRAGDEELLFGKGLDGQSNCKRKKTIFKITVVRINENLYA